MDDRKPNGIDLLEESSLREGTTKQSFMLVILAVKIPSSAEKAFTAMTHSRGYVNSSAMKDLLTVLYYSFKRFFTAFQNDSNITCFAVKLQIRKLKT
ncbi:hypothetical protein [Pedobacter terrae]|uniref:hypothetical protein n=1 Tax=Pedobacter terrae TaxID=405671 RepID=UPI002FF85336